MVQSSAWPISADDALDRILQRHHRAVRDDVHRRLGARPDPAIGGEQVERGRLPRRLAHQLQPLGRAAREHVAAEPVAAHQPRPGLAHRVEPLQPQLEPQRQFLGARVGRRSLGSSRQDLR